MTALTSNGVITRLPNWKPDGSKIVFDQGPAGSADVWVMSQDGSGQTNLTNNGGQINEAAAWSPDAAKIVFDSFRDGDGQVYVMNADGTGQTRLTSTGRNGGPNWQPLPIVAPDCSGAQASPSTIWSPNHGFVPIAIIGVTQPNGAPVTITPASVFQDEPIQKPSTPKSIVSQTSARSLRVGAQEAEHHYWP